MSRVQELLSEYMAEHRRSGRADPFPYLDDVEGAEHAELAALIDHYLTTAPKQSFDAAAFNRFRARPEVTEMAQRILDPEAQTLEELRKRAGVRKQQLGERLAHDLGLEGSAREAKSRYHDIETGFVDPRRVRHRVWDSLASTFGSTVDAVRAGAAGAFANAIMTQQNLGGAFARTKAGHANTAVELPGRTEAQRRVDDAFFERDD